MSPVELPTLRLIARDEHALAEMLAGGASDVSVAVTTVDGGGAGDGETPAVLRLRGATTRQTAQKSFQLTLAGTPARELALNKHPFDLTRVRNKLAFDSFAAVPHLDRVSPRADFVRLNLNGADLGLFTRIDDPDAAFLAARGLSTRGTLYRARAFFWQPIDAATAGDAAALAAVVEPRHNPDPARLLRTVDDIADPAQDVDDVVARHFQRDNYLAWLAVNVLTGNQDTIAHNYLIYGPPDGGGWLFIPWDYDGAFDYYRQPGEPPPPPGARAGLANWWSVPLFQRFVGKPANLRDLDRRIDELAAGPLAGDQVRARLGAYRDLVRPLVTAPPDVEHLPTGDAVTAEEKAARWDAEYARLDGVVSRCLAEHRAARGRPMPVWLYEPAPAGGGAGEGGGGALVFSWSPSALPGADGQGLHYDLELSAASNFAPDEIVVVLRGLRQPRATATIPPGARFWRVVIRSDHDPNVNWQTPFGEGHATLGGGH